MRPSLLLEALLVLLILPLRGVLAFEPALVDQLMDPDGLNRQGAYQRAAELSTAEKINLAPFLAERLDDAKRGEFAAMALSRLGDVGVPYLDRHARSSIPGSEFAAMGLLVGKASGPSALAAILRDGDEKAVLRSLAVIEASTVMPPVVGEEVKRLAGDTNLHFTRPARAALEAVAKAAQAPQDAASTGTDMDLLNAPGASAPSEEMLTKLLAELRSSGPAGQQALSDALDSGAIDKDMYDQIQTMLGASPSTRSTPVAEKTPWQPDTSQYKTRQSAADSFSKNR